MSGGGDLHRRIAAAQADDGMIRAVRLATLHKVDSRAAALAALRDPDAIREHAAQIRRHTLERLPDYLAQFAENLERRGARTHFAADADQARAIVQRIAVDRGCRLAVKSKSMVSEEIELNAALAGVGVRVIETDLGEFIVQIDGDRPSHIVTPIIHKDRAACARALQREIGCEYTEDPRELTAIARRYLRDRFRECDLGISGVNFGIAETGTLCLCTNEGNGRMTTTRPRVHVAVMGIERLVPRTIDLGPMLKLLARSSTGQPLTVYTTFITGPARASDGDGPHELHVVLIDNGRSPLLGGPYESVLHCIRCGACLNACPVYRNVGGHAYASVYPGPIGSLVTPLLSRARAGAELSRASSLCGACLSACPVKIDIPELLVRLRAETSGDAPLLKRLGLRIWSWIVASPWRYVASQRLLRVLLEPGEDGWARRGPGPGDAWTQWRDLPVPRRTFRDVWRQTLADEAHSCRSGAPEFAPAQPPQAEPAGRRSAPAEPAINPPARPPGELGRFVESLRRRVAGRITPTTLPASHEAIRQVAHGERLVERFENAASAAGMRVLCVTAEAAPAIVADCVGAAGCTRVLCPPSDDGALSGSLRSAVLSAVNARGATAISSPDDDDLFAAHAAVTGVAAVVAETGSLVCVSGQGRMRSLTLAPPLHVAVVGASQILPDGIDALSASALADGWPANVTWITGPSKTADIEGVLVTGVHGPGQVCVVLLTDR